VSARPVYPGAAFTSPAARRAVAVMKAEESTMADLTHANAARLDAALDKPYRFSFGIATFRQAAEAGRFSHCEASTKPAVEWNRRKFNRMDARQQAEYQRKLDTLVPSYQLYIAGCHHDSYVECPKMVFDWFKARGLPCATPA
jgi:hypothetical protein